MVMMVWHRISNQFSKHRTSKTRRPRRRPLAVQHLVRRELLAADIGAIGGVVFTDQALDGLTAGDPRLSGVQVQLFEDTNNDGTFDAGDLLVGTDITNANGEFRFDGLSTGTYFIQQAAVAGLVSPTVTMVEVVNDGGVQVQPIDSYETATPPVTATVGTPSIEGSTLAAEAIGGERNVQAIHTSGVSSVEVEVAEIGDMLTISAGAGTAGSALIQYDGPDGTIALDPLGLNSADLSGGDAFAGINISIAADNPGGTMELRFYTNATDFSSRTLNIPDTAGMFSEFFVPFSTFTPLGNGADFTDIGAIEVLVDIVANLDVAVTIIESVRPELVTVNLANIQLVNLGGEIFLDNSVGGQNNGFRDPSEPGLTGITVDLYRLADANDIVDPLTASPIASTVTGANGAYLFQNLEPGHYAAVIPATQFAVGGNLFGFANSTGNDPPSDPNDNVDGDDSGTTLASGDVISGTISLVANNEPDDDGDPNTNTTLDFGFFPQIDLSISKTVNAAESNIRENGQVVFDIAILNDAPAGTNLVDATNVVFTDTLPAGLTFVEFRNLPAAASQPTVNGQTASVNVGTISPNQAAVEFQIVADIAANQTVDITNTASVATSDQVDVNPANNADPEVVALTSADLVITKTDTPDPVSAGGQLTYVITVQNNGPDTAQGIVVTDTLPPEVTFVPNSGTFLSGTGVITEPAAPGDDVVINVGDLASGASAEIQITVTVADNAPGTINNVATVTSDPNNDPDLSNNTTNEETTVERTVDVAIAKSLAAGSSVVAGGQFTYVIEVTNNGPSEARGVQVTDALDAALTFVSFDAGTSGVTRVAGDDQNLTFDVGTLAAQQTETFTITVALDSSATGTLENEAVITTTDIDTNAANDRDTVSNAIARDIVLAVTKSVNVTTAVPGVVDPNNPALVYTIVVTNNGVSDATGVFVTDDLSDEFAANRITSVAIDPGVGTVSNDTTTQTPRVDFGTVPAGESRQFTITAEIPAGATGVIDNEAVANSDAGTPVTSAEVTTTLTPQFDLIVDKSVTGNGNVGPGDQVTFNILVSHNTENGGQSPSTATGVVITDELPAGLTFVSATLGGNAVSLTPDANGVLTFPAFDLAPGATRAATIVATVNANASGTLTNTVSIAADAGETDTTNNSDTAIVTATPRAELTVAKSVNDTLSQPGGTLVYSVTVTNSGPSAASNVVATDTLPAGVTFVSGTDPNGATFTSTVGNVNVSGQTITVNGGTLDANESFSFSITATVNAGVTAPQVNNVSVTTDTPEGDPNNNSASATTTIDPRTSSIQGAVFVDLNNDGIQDPGEAIPNVQIQLSGTNVFGQQVSANTTTDANGNYVFDNLAAGTYTVTQIQPPGFRQGSEVVGTNANPNPTVTDNVFAQMGLAANTNAAGFNFIELELLDALSKRRFLASYVP